MFKSKNCSNIKKCNLKIIQIWKKIKYENCSNLKIVQILKIFKFENCSNQKIVQALKNWDLKIIQIWKMFKYEICSNLNKFEIQKLMKKTENKLKNRINQTSEKIQRKTRKKN
jgi:phosphoribosylanthranilate isomerase